MYCVSPDFENLLLNLGSLWLPCVDVILGAYFCANLSFLTGLSKIDLSHSWIQYMIADKIESDTFLTVLAFCLYEDDGKCDAKL